MSTAAGPPVPLSCGEDETLIINGPDSASCQPPDGPPVPLSCPTGQTLVTSTEPNSASCQPAAGPPVPLSCDEGETLIINGPDSASCQPPAWSTSIIVMSYRSDTSYFY